MGSGLVAVFFGLPKKTELVSLFQGLLKELDIMSTSFLAFFLLFFSSSNRQFRDISPRIFCPNMSNNVDIAQLL